MMYTAQDTHSILIVDDSQAVRESLGWLLRDENNMKVAAEAASGKEAIQLAVKLEPDLVILDIELPDMDGFSVTQQLKALPHPPIVVLLSIHGDANSQKRGVLAGCDAFLEKGMTWPKLLERIQKVIKLTKQEYKGLRKSSTRNDCNLI
jgi:CheY-like chemotaxis protein